MTKAHFVIDTNTLVSGLLFGKKSIPKQAIDKATKVGRLLISSDTLDELIEVFEREKFNKYFPYQERMEALKDFVKLCKLIEIEERVEACRDSKDDKFLEVAVNGQAFAIVTGDKDLLVLNPFRDIPILTAREFLDSFKEDDKS